MPGMMPGMGGQPAGATTLRVYNVGDLTTVPANYPYRITSIPTVQLGRESIPAPPKFSGGFGGGGGGGLGGMAGGGMGGMGGGVLRRTKRQVASAKWSTKSRQ